MSSRSERIKRFFDNPLKRDGMEAEHDRLDAEHFDREAEKFLADGREKELVIDLKEEQPPRHKAFWAILSDVRGKKILDVGCGYGYSACRLAMLGADVTAIDISKKMCDLTKMSADLNHVNINVRNMSVVSTGFPDEYFDIIVGQVSLHHLPLSTAGAEMKRVLKKNGKAVFLEPIHQGKFMLELRSRIPVECLESPGGGALRIEEIKALGNLFGTVEIEYFGFFERLRRFRFFNFFSKILYAMDSALMKIPFGRKLASHALIVLKKHK